MRARILLYVVPLLGFFVSASLGAAGPIIQRTIFKNNIPDTNIQIQYRFQAGGPYVRRVLAPKTVMMVSGDITDILWNTEGAFLAGKTNPLPPHRPSLYTQVSFKNGRTPQPSIRGCNNLRDCAGNELTTRGITDLLSIFPALKTREKTTSWLLRRLTTRTYGFKQNPMVAALIESLGLDQHVAARYILGLPQTPTLQEIEHAYSTYKEDLRASSRELMGNSLVPDDIHYALDESARLLRSYAEKTPGYPQRATTGDVLFSFHNKTDQPVYLATYYVTETNQATRAQGVIDSIQPREQKPITAAPASGPRAATGVRRRILASFNQAELKNYLTEDEYLRIANADVTGLTRNIVNFVTGKWGTSLVYLIKDKDTGTLRVLRTYEFPDKEVKAMAEKLEKTFNTELAQLKQTWVDGEVHGQHYFTTVDETFINRRMHKVKPAFQKLLNKPNLTNDDVPRVGIAFTGGGYRAMTEAIGYATGAQETGILDYVSYISGLSGSTWALAAFLDWKRVHGTNSFRQLGDNLKNRVNIDLLSMYPSKEDLILLNHITNIKKALQMPSTTFIGLRYGFALAKALLAANNEQDRQKVRLSDLQKSVDYTMPLPILTAVSIYSSYVTSFELSPLIVGTHQHGSKWIVPNLFGRKFKIGKTVPEKGMEEYLGYTMAICGSAYAARYKAALEQAPQVPGISPLLDLTPEWLSKWFEETILEAKFWRPKEFNFTAGYGDGVGGGREIIHMVDGAHDILKRHDGKSIINNFAAVPLLARNVDFLIMCDCTNAISADHFIAAGLRAKQLGLPFPYVANNPTKFLQESHRIEANMSINKPTLIYDKNNPSAPVIVILATMPDHAYDPHFNPLTESFTSTFNFKYTPQQFDLLRGLSEHSMRKAEPEIQQALKLAYQNRQRRRSGG